MFVLLSLICAEMCPDQKAVDHCNTSEDVINALWEEGACKLVVADNDILEKIVCDNFRWHCEAGIIGTNLSSEEICECNCGFGNGAKTVSSVSAILVAGGAAALIYFCCCRRDRVS
jgi:hypothetical protein